MGQTELVRLEGPRAATSVERSSASEDFFLEDGAVAGFVELFFKAIGGVVAVPDPG